MVAQISKVLFRVKWLTMSHRQRYSYFWLRGGSLRH